MSSRNSQVELEWRFPAPASQSSNVMLFCQHSCTNINRLGKGWSREEGEGEEGGKEERWSKEVWRREEGGEREREEERRKQGGRRERRGNVQLGW